MELIVSYSNSKQKYAKRQPSTNAMIDPMNAYGYHGPLIIYLVSSAFSKFTKVINIKSASMPAESIM